MISEPYKANFQTLLTAAANDDLALVECTERHSDQPAYVVCAVNQHADGDVYLVPIARLFDDDPYELLDPPA